MLLSLEHYDEEEESATKADIFFRRTVSRIEEPSRAEAPDQALALSMQWKGRVDPDYMARLLRADPLGVIRDLCDRGMVYKNPETECYETADAYLSGDVKRKLDIAVAAGAEFVGMKTRRGARSCAGSTTTCSTACGNASSTAHTPVAARLLALLRAPQ